MKIILSRKGFDDSNGGCASPILPDGTMLSMPIPSVEDDILYDQLQYNGINYADILKQINPKNYSYTTCHLDRIFVQIYALNPLKMDTCIWPDRFCSGIVEKCWRYCR